MAISYFTKSLSLYFLLKSEAFYLIRSSTYNITILSDILSMILNVIGVKEKQGNYKNFN